MLFTIRYILSPLKKKIYAVGENVIQSPVEPWESVSIKVKLPLDETLYKYRLLKLLSTKYFPSKEKLPIVPDCVSVCLRVMTVVVDISYILTVPPKLITTNNFLLGDSITCVLVEVLEEDISFIV